MTIDVQKPVQEAIDRLVESGAERGVQVGAGGSFACADTSTGIAFAVTKNRTPIEWCHGGSFTRDLETCAGHLLEVSGALSARLGRRA